MKKLPKFSNENKKLKIHFIGIGEIEDSVLAQYFLTKGHQVSLSSLYSKNLQELSRNYDLVIYTSIVKIKSRPLNFLGYQEAISKLTKEYFTIAISGSYGKSTTVAMTSIILTKAGFDPTVFVGAKIKEFGDLRCRVGKSRYLVIEASEYSNSFLNYYPKIKIMVITNLEKDRFRVFKKIINCLPKKGILIINESLENTILPISKNTSSFSLEQRESAKIRKILKVPGEHNVYNALAALAVARALKIPDRISLKALSEYKGCRRRFEIKRTRQGIIVDDYAHHSLEIKVTLRTAREKWPKKEIWCIFQFPQDQESGPFLNNLVRTFREAPVDKIIITNLYDFYSKVDINSKKLVKAIGKQNVSYIPRNKTINYIKNNFPIRGVVVIMGKRDIFSTKESMSFLTGFTK